jgi:hypothetical protein
MLKGLLPLASRRRADVENRARQREVVVVAGGCALLAVDDRLAVHLGLRR